MHPDVAAALFDDPVDGRQSEPRALGNLRRKERFENMRLCFFVHTAAVILYGQQNVFPGFQVVRMDTLAFGQIDVACLETYRAGSEGPAKAEELLARDGRSWRKLG